MRRSVIAVTAIVGALLLVGGIAVAAPGAGPTVAQQPSPHPSDCEPPGQPPDRPPSERPPQYPPGRPSDRPPECQSQGDPPEEAGRTNPEEGEENPGDNNPGQGEDNGASAQTNTTSTQSGEPVATQGSGWQPNSKARGHFRSDPVFLGEVTVNENGSFSTVWRIPAHAAPGQHTLEIAGFGPDGQPRLVQIPMVVTGAPLAVATDTGGVPVGVALVVVLLVAGAGALLLVRRTRRLEPA